MKKSSKLLCVVLAMTLCGCAGQSGNTVPSETEPAIKLAAPADGASVDLNNPRMQAFLGNYQDEFDIGSSQDYAGQGEILPMEALKLQWTALPNAQGYEVSLGTDAALTDARAYTCTSNELSLQNLVPGTTYYWQVSASVGKSAVWSFTVEGTVRPVLVDGVSNIRDVGDGEIMKMGLVYRSAKLDDITGAGQKEMLENLGIRTDLDLRKTGEGTAGTGSPLGERVQYIHVENAPYYCDNAGIQRPGYRDALAQELRVFADASNFPVVIHCSIGRDRTGTLVYLLKAVCGVKLLDITKDYELSLLSEAGCRDNTPAKTLLNGFNSITGLLMRQEGKTLQEKTVSFMLSIGLTQQEITAIQTNLTQ